MHILFIYTGIYCSIVKSCFQKSETKIDGFLMKNKKLPKPKPEKMSTNITFNGNINVYFNSNGAADVSVDVNDDLTSQTMADLIAQIIADGIAGAIAIAPEKKTSTLNPNAPEFIPSSVKQNAVDDNNSSDCSYSDDDSDYIPDDDSEAEKDEFLEKSALFKKVCSANKIDYSLDLFQKYLRWDENNSGKGLNRYQKMTEFVKNSASSANDTEALRRATELINVIVEAKGGKRRDVEIDENSSTNGAEALKIVNDIIGAYSTLHATPIAPVRNGANALSSVNSVINVFKNAYSNEKNDDAPAHIEATKKVSQKNRDAGKVKLFKEICEENGDAYSLALFDDYEEWCKTNGAGLNRYKKMHKFLDSLSNTNSSNDDRA
jgi:hypothetical protein